MLLFFFYGSFPALHLHSSAHLLHHRYYVCLCCNLCLSFCVPIMLQLIDSMFSILISGISSKSCLFLGTKKKLHILILLLFSILTVNLPHCVMVIPLYVLNLMFSFFIAASYSFLDLGNNFF